MSESTETTSLIDEMAEIKKQEFIKLVGHLSKLRDAQYQMDDAERVVENAKKVVAVNLPSNLLRAAAIFVDYRYGFPPDQHSFWPPKWVTAREVLPIGERASLICTGFTEITELEENDVVVLTGDLPVHGLHAGMAGIVRQRPWNGDDPDKCLVEFGEREDCSQIEAEVPVSLLRTPRPGDLLENFRV